MGVVCLFITLLMRLMSCAASCTTCVRGCAIVVARWHRLFNPRSNMVTREWVMASVLWVGNNRSSMSTRSYTNPMR
eukprot:151103-Chlamydomonas_euryale.AAC.1